MNFVLFNPRLLVIVISATSVASNQKYLVCKTVEDIFASTSNAGNHNRSVTRQDRREGLGPTGRPGVRGRPGPQGVVDYDIINNTIEVKLQEVISTIRKSEQESYDKLETALFQLTCDMAGGVVSREICYFYHLTKVTYQEALALCTKYNSTLASFRDRSQQISIQDGIREKLSSGSLYFWTGMKYSSLRRTVAFKPGREVNFEHYQWHSEHPTGDNRVLSVEIDKADRNHGGLSSEPTSNRRNVLCETQLSYS